MANRRMERATLEDAKIRFRNFEGRAGQYNRAGDRNFAIFLEPDVATAMVEDGWNVKQLQARDEGDVPQDYLTVKINYPPSGSGIRPPKVVLITSKGKTELNEDDLSMLDWAEIAKADVIIRPYQWNVGGKTGVSAYLYSIYVTIVEDELEVKYSDLMDSAQNAREFTPPSEPTVSFKEEAF